MSKEDIDKAVEEAEQYVAEDAKTKEKVEIRNQADQLLYQSEKLYSSKDGQGAPNAGPSEAANADNVYDADYKVVDDDNA